jgi:hypothetical protein
MTMTLTEGPKKFINLYLLSKKMLITYWKHLQIITWNDHSLTKNIDLPYLHNFNELYLF